VRQLPNTERRLLELLVALTLAATIANFAFFVSIRSSNNSAHAIINAHVLEDCRRIDVVAANQLDVLTALDRAHVDGLHGRIVRDLARLHKEVCPS
jgi:hypothetical protein